MPLVLAVIVTLTLAGVSVARAVTAPALDAHIDLQFSLDGDTWTDAPDLVLGAWGCDLDDGSTAAVAAVTAGPAVATGPATAGPAVDPCAMLPGESVDRTYHVRNATDSGRTGRYEVGVGDFEVSDGAEFAVSSAIAIAAGASDSGTVMLYGPGTGRAGSSPARGETVAALDLAPGESARVVDEVSVPLGVPNSAQRQSVSPRLWISFSDVVGLDRDGDGLPDSTEDLLGTDPGDPLNRLPDAIVGRDYGPGRFLPTPPEGTALDVDTSTLPPGVRLEDGVLTGAPTRAGTYDIAFTVTLPSGATYTSVRRVVVHPASGGGSSDLPDLVWPVIVGGVIGVVIGLVGPGLGSVAGSIGGPASSAWSTWSTGPTSSSGSRSLAPDSDRARPGGPGEPTTAESDGTGQVPENTVRRRDGAPSDEWVRANSEVRGTLATTGVSGAELVLWALTAAAAGATLVLFARRRHEVRDDDTGDEA